MAKLEREWFVTAAVEAVSLRSLAYCWARKYEVRGSKYEVARLKPKLFTIAAVEIITPLRRLCVSLANREIYGEQLLQ